jgi:hypothetical protein
VRIIKSLSALTVVLCLCAGSALADNGRVSSRSLEKMGLGTMKPLTDAEGMKIRGAGRNEIGEILRAIDRIEDKIERLIAVFTHHHHK